MKEKCVVVLSGGVDSATVTYWAKKQGYDIYAITFNYGQIASRETQAAQKIAQNLNVHIKVVDISPLKEVFGEVTSLCNPNIPMTSTFSDHIIVPFRNAIFLSIAVSYATSIGADKIFYGAHGSDETFYPDCRKEFYKALEKAARLGTDKQITIDAPFSGKPKTEIIKIGKKLNVPFELTWSCYFNNVKHCGKCESCVNRKQAFQEAKVLDPTAYEE
ncbi:MAG: 7-cyano-7-deazaguanine synthase QueC [Candidatus Bathyarchaeota archaeon]|nr:7-cyano-7-deazaguanine synthase QueC [Candidatus Bathyarchaeota archaeon]